MRLLMLLGLLALALLAGWLYLNSSDGPQITSQKATLATPKSCTDGVSVTPPMLQKIKDKLNTHLTLASHCQVTFVGTVEAIKHEPDGDWHVLIRPQTGSMRFVRGPSVDLIRGCGLTKDELQNLKDNAPDALILAEVTQTDSKRLKITPHTRITGMGAFVFDNDGAYLQAKNGKTKGPKIYHHCEVHPLYSIGTP